MKRNLITILSLVVMSLMLSATGAYAQYHPQSYAKANVPFTFHVGTAQLPAGCYRILTQYQGIAIRNCKTGATVFSPVQRESPRDTAAQLVFDHLDNQYFLTQIWGAAGSVGMTVPSSKLERELQVAGGPSHASKKIMIALN